VKNAAAATATLSTPLELRPPLVASRSQTSRASIRRFSEVRVWSERRTNCRRFSEVGVWSERRTGCRRFLLLSCFLASD